MINFDHYRVFYFAAQAENFSTAAGLLNVTQPAVSSTIRLLEKSLNVRLFERSGRNVVLTSEGQTLFSYVKRAMQSFAEGEEHLSNFSSMADGVVRIGASDTIAKFFIFDDIKKFSEDFPRIRVLVQHKSSPQTLEALKKGEIDLAFVNWHSSLNLGSFDKIRINKLPHYFACNDKYYSKLPKRPTLKELAKEPIISLERRSSTRTVLDQFFASKGIIFAPHIEFGSYDLILQAIHQDMGIGVIPKQIAGNLHLIHTDVALPETEIFVVTNQGSELPVAAKKLLGRFYGQ